MKKMLKYLSPFAPDQSGVSGVLFELGGLIVICDAGGCTGNICGFDEPRWFTKKSAVFSAGLRDMDAIMGRDDKLIEKLSDAQKILNCKFTALIATPVPAVIGTDMKALKRMAEKKTGVPCISINAIGTKYYDEGESLAWYELFNEFAGKEVEEYSSAVAQTETSVLAQGEDSSLSSVGVIGATPLETGYSNSEKLIEMCEAAGIENPVIYGMGTGRDEIRNAGKVKKNLVVSVGGLKAAKYLQENFGTEYEVGYPFIPEQVLEDIEKIEKIDDDSERIPERILIIHSQFAANELRNRIRDKFRNLNGTINCATFFMQEEEYSEDGDIRLAGEDELWELAKSDTYDLIIADTDIKRLLNAAGYSGKYIEFPQFSISGVPMDSGKTLYN